jgi:hypothetical protein
MYLAEVVCPLMTEFNKRNVISLFSRRKSLSQKQRLLALFLNQKAGPAKIPKVL